MDPVFFPVQWNFDNRDRFERWPNRAILWVSCSTASCAATWKIFQLTEISRHLKWRFIEFDCTVVYRYSEIPSLSLWTWRRLSLISVPENLAKDFLLLLSCSNKVWKKRSKWKKEAPERVFRKMSRTRVKRFIRFLSACSFKEKKRKNILAVQKMGEKPVRNFFLLLSSPPKSFFLVSSWLQPPLHLRKKRVRGGRRRRRRRRRRSLQRRCGLLSFSLPYLRRPQWSPVNGKVPVYVKYTASRIFFFI